MGSYYLFYFISFIFCLVNLWGKTSDSNQCTRTPSRNGNTLFLSEKPKQRKSPRSQAAATINPGHPSPTRVPIAASDHPIRASQICNPSTSKKNPRLKLKKNQRNTATHSPKNPTSTRIAYRTLTQPKSEARSTNFEHQKRRFKVYDVEGESCSPQKRRWQIKNFKKKKKGKSGCGSEVKRKPVKRGRSGRKQWRLKISASRDGAPGLWLPLLGWWRRWTPPTKRHGSPQDSASSVFASEDSVLWFRNRTFRRPSGSLSWAKRLEDGMGLIPFPPCKTDKHQRKKPEEIREKRMQKQKGGARWHREKERIKHRERNGGQESNRNKESTGKEEQDLLSPPPLPHEVV